ncbi:MAG: SDR family oxidoreductase [Proteobacteria bacterium]|nr:SDR family oxidoreductase [Pseudomonadota bacterium]
MRDPRFIGKAAIITGAASGIGRATAERLAAEGATLALGDIDSDPLEEVADALRRHGNAVHPIAFDAADPGSCRQLVTRAASTMGSLDVLCNIAGYYQRHRFTEIADTDWDRMLAVNLGSVFHLTKAALPHLVRSKGNIVNIASTAGLAGLAYAAHYSVAKAGIVALTKSLAAEYGEFHVRVNVVCPGGVKTNIGRNLTPVADANPQLLARLNPKLGTGERGAPEDIAAAFAYLASDEARYVSGAVLVVDGAQLAG